MAKDITKLREEFINNFGELNGLQLWTIVKIAKHVRLRARNNSAFNNFMNALVPNAQFRTVKKSRKSWKTGLDEFYDGLEITVNKVVVEQEEGED